MTLTLPTLRRRRRNDDEGRQVHHEQQRPSTSHRKMQQQQQQQQHSNMGGAHADDRHHQLTKTGSLGASSSSHSNTRPSSAGSESDSSPSSTRPRSSSSSYHDGSAEKSKMRSIATGGGGAAAEATTATKATKIGKEQHKQQVRPDWQLSSSFSSSSSTTGGSGGGGGGFAAANGDDARVPRKVDEQGQVVAVAATTNGKRRGGNLGECSYTRHYYSEERLFEKSLDIYLPPPPAPPPSSTMGEEERTDCALSDSSNNSSTSMGSSTRDMFVILVVGSGWLGHYHFVYLQTSWWNSSGPKTVARSLNCPCICVRHRGAFPTVPAPVVVAAAVVGYALALVGFFLRGNGFDSELFRIAIASTTVVVALSLLVGRGSARFPDMVNDVAEAISWVHENYQPLGTTSVDQRGHQHHSSSKPKVVFFGGYSSGGHVAASLMQRPDLFASKGLPTAEKLFDAVLYISGVLAVRPTAAIMPPPSRVPSNQSGADQERHDSTNNSSSSSVTSRLPPRWLTDLVMKVVWGDASSRIPSPIESLVQQQQPPPRIPHFLIGCRNEVFGLNWLDLFFCSKDYCEVLRRCNGGMSAKYVEVNSDHWNILGSAGLHDALRYGAAFWIFKHLNFEKCR